MDPSPPAAARSPQNIVHFARALREAGVPVGPGAVLDALAAVEAAGFGDRRDFYATLHAVFVKKHEHSLLFDQAFADLLEAQGLARKADRDAVAAGAERSGSRKRAEAGASRVADALFKSQPEEPKAVPSIDLDARFTVSEQEILRAKDFAQMSAAEIEEARKLIRALAMPDDRRPAFAGSSHRAACRGSIRAAASAARCSRAARSTSIIARRWSAPPPIVALCDISGSMSEYTRLFLHFLHALGETRRVSTFLFGTRLTNVTRAMRARDPDEALARCAKLTVDWSGGTRIGEAFARFNRDWARRVLGQGAIVLLFTDGLERDGARRSRPRGRAAAQVEPAGDLGQPAAALRRLLRRGREGVRAILPHVDAFRPIHNLSSMADLCATLAGAGTAGKIRRHGSQRPPDAGSRLAACAGASRFATAATRSWLHRSGNRAGKALSMLTREEDVLAAAEAWREFRARSGDRDGRRDLGLGAAAGRLPSRHRRRWQFPRLGQSGGCVEGAVVEEAAEVIASGAPRMLEFGVADETAWRVGLSCGGRIKVYVEKVN